MLGQDTSDSLQILSGIPPTNTFFSNFDKQLSTYRLNTGLNYSGELSDFSYGLKENFRSTLLRSTTQSVRDEQYFILAGKYKVSDSYKFGIAANSSILSDDRNTLLNKTTINYLLLFNEIYFSRKFVLSPFIGYSNNIQIGEDDRGLIYGFEGSAQDYSTEDFSLSSTLKFRNEDIFPRRNLLRYISIGFTNPFNQDVTNLIAGKFSISRKDFYFPSDSITSLTFNITNNIEDRTESVYSAEDMLRYQNILENTNLEITGAVNWRTIEREKRYKSTELQSKDIFDSNINELNLLLGSTMYYNSSFFKGSLSFHFSERDEKHVAKSFQGADEFFFNSRSEDESRKNNNSKRATLAFKGIFNLSGTDKLTLSAYHNKLRYDTPSDQNDDDRDEILSILRLRYSKNLSPFFQAFINTEATVSHIVYLFASRSSNNNINRVLRFAAGGFYSGAQITSLNTFEVSANYTVYDFEDLSTSLKSLSFRQFTATDSSHILFSKNFGIVITGYVKLSQQADLNWKDFAERPTRYLREVYADPMIEIKYKEAIFGIGMRYFSLDTYKYDKRNKKPDTGYRSIGPLMEILYSIYNSLYLKINGWYEFISVNDVQKDERANLVMEMNWNF